MAQKLGGEWTTAVGAECRTLNGCLENTCISRTNRIKPKKDTTCLLPCWTVSKKNHNTTNSKMAPFTTLGRMESGTRMNEYTEELRTLETHWELSKLVMVRSVAHVQFCCPDLFLTVRAYFKGPARFSAASSLHSPV